MIKIRNFPKEPTPIVRTATAEELANYEKLYSQARISQEINHANQEARIDIGNNALLLALYELNN